MSDEERKPAPRIGEEGLGGRMGFIIGVGFLCALALAGAYFAYQFYSSSGPRPAPPLPPAASVHAPH